VIHVERVVLPGELVGAVLPPLLPLGRTVLLHHFLVIFIILSFNDYFLFTLVVKVIILVVLMGFQLEETPGRVVVDVYVELLLVMELLHGGTVNTDDISDIGDHREIFLSLSVDDYCRINRGKGICASSVVEGMVYNFQCANVFSLIRAIRETCIDNNSEKVVMIILGVQIRLFERCIHILTL
jgi:hypothetical protein